MIWETKAWFVPYVTELSKEAKIAGLSRVWAEGKWNFPNFADVSTMDWDSLYFASIPLVSGTQNTAEYYRELQRVVAKLNDGHSYVFLPPQLQAQLAAPPLRTDRIDGRVFITGVMSGRLTAQGVVPGMELLRVDGEPVDSYVTRTRLPFMGSNTAQHREVLHYSHELLEGPSKSPVRLTLRTVDRAIVERDIPRSGYQDVAPYQRAEFRVLPGRIAYLALNSFASDSIERDVERWLPEMRASTCLVIDVRQNSGGSGVVAYNLVGQLIPDSFPLPKLASRQYIATRRAWGQAGTWWSPGLQLWPGRGAGAVTVPVAVLTGPRTLSAAEVFVEALRLSKRATIIGEPTGGSTGDPLAFALPGGGVAQIATSANLGAVRPDILAARTASDFLAGRDAALAAALAATCTGSN